MQCNLGQGFGLNFNPFYRNSGLLGHPAVDATCGYGSDVFAHFPGIVVNVVSKGNAGREGYTLVSQLVDDGIECFEWIVGHLNPTVAVGDYIAKGDKLGTEANNGKVYAGNIEITLAMQRAGDTRGQHRHYQKRPLIPVDKTDGYSEYLSGQNYRHFYDGKYYKVAEPNNGYAGCINPLGPVFHKDRWPGAYGADIFVLQRILYRQGFLAAEPNGRFGPQTLSALMRWQKALGISPAPIFGPRSRQMAQRMVAPPPSLLGS